MGISKNSIYEKNYNFFFAQDGEGIESTDQIDGFLKLIFPYSHEYTVYFVVSDLIKEVEESVGAFGVSLLAQLPDDIANLKAETPEFIANTEECYVGVGPVQSFDVFSAQEKASQRLGRLSDLFTVFHHQQKISWKETALVKQCCLEKPVVSKLASCAMEKPFDLRPQKASKELNRLLRNLSIQGASYDRFNRVADLHGICVANEIVDNQLVTLWTSLETLIPSRTGSSKIVNVLDGMVPFLMRSYARRLIERFTHDLIIWRRWSAKKILNKVPEISTTNLTHRALALLAVQGNDDLRRELYAELKDFHLLRFRAFQLAEIFSSPQSLRETLKVHETKVRWQIRRIYRTRNLLVHSGTRPSYIHTLVENAHDYLDQIFFDVMELSCGAYQAQNLGQIFELAKIRYARFNKDLNDIETFDVTNCKFLCADVNVLSDFENETWGIRSETDN